MTLTKEQQLAELAVKKEEFHKYLDRTGVLDCFVHAFVALYEDLDRPEYPLDYIGLQMALAADGPRREQIEMFKSTVSNARDKLMEKEAENQRLQQELEEKFGGTKEPEAEEEAQEEEDEEEEEEEDEHETENTTAPVPDEPKLPEPTPSKNNAVESEHDAEVV